MDTDKLETAQDFAARAAELVGGDRARTHGSKGLNFRTTACLWNAYLTAKAMTLTDGWTAEEVRITGQDFAIMMILAKMSRVLSGAYNADDFVDMAGYAACAGEVARQLENGEG